MKASVHQGIARMGDSPNKLNREALHCKPTHKNKCRHLQRAQCRSLFSDLHLPILHWLLFLYSGDSQQRNVENCSTFITNMALKCQ